MLILLRIIAQAESRPNQLRLSLGAGRTYIRFVRACPDYGDKRAEIDGSDPGAMPGGSTSLRSLRELRLGKPATKIAAQRAKAAAP